MQRGRSHYRKNKSWTKQFIDAKEGRKKPNFSMPEKKGNQGSHAMTFQTLKNLLKFYNRKKGKKVR